MLDSVRPRTGPSDDTLPPTDERDLQPIEPSERLVEIERARIQAANVAGSVLLQLGVVAIAGAIVLQGSTSRYLALAGLLLFPLLAGLALIARHIASDGARMRRLRMWRLGLLGIALATALLIGLAAAAAMNGVPVANKVVATSLLLAVYAVSMSAHHAHPTAILAVGVVMLGPSAVAWFGDGGSFDRFVSLALVLISFVSWLVSLGNARALTDSIRRRLQVEALSRELDIRSRQMEAAMRAKTQFLAAASHDLRQPVTSLNLLLAAARHAKHSAGDGVDRLIRQMQPAVDAMATILDSMLEMSRLEAGLIRANVRPVDLRALLLSIQVAYTPQAQARRLHLYSELDPAMVATDPDLLGRIVRNLVDNALKYTPSGSIGLRAQVSATQVEISLSDTGIGIAPEICERIFDDYYQADNPNRDRGLGLGLGLSIVRRLLALLGGTISVQSTPGKGSTFTVRLPSERALQPSVRWQADAVNLADALTGKSCLLVVDDDPLIRDAFASILADLPIQSRIAHNPHEALTLGCHDGEAVDVAIADYRLPGGIDGIRLLETLRESNATLAAILMTGDLDPALVGRAAALGAALLHKPFDTDELAQAVLNARQLAAARSAAISAAAPPAPIPASPPPN